jgi:two-component system, NarL family, invasion response regulator UvrY
MIRVLIADDHPLFRAGIRRTLEEAGETSVAGEAATGEEVIQLLRKVKADILLLDVFMPGMGFLELLRRVRSEHPDLPTLVVSMQPEEQCAVRAFRAGAAGYLNKERSSDQLVSAVRTVAQGRRYYSAELADRLVSGLGSPSPRLPHESLSDREYEVLCLIGSGRTVKEIAYQLSLSPKTVGTYRTRLMQKMKVRTGADLVRYAVQQGLTV